MNGILILTIISCLLSLFVELVGAFVDFVTFFVDSAEFVGVFVDLIGLIFLLPPADYLRLLAPQQLWGQRQL